MKTNLLTLTIVALLAGFFVSTAASQVVVTVGQMDLNTGFGTSAGTIGMVSAPTGSTTAVHSFTVTDLDIAEDGSANDTVVFSYDVTSTNGNIALVAGTTFAYGVDGASDPADNEIDLDEGLSFSNLNAEVTFGDPTSNTLNIVSAEFNFFFSRYPGGGDVVNLVDSNGSPISITSTPDGGADDLYRFEFPQTAFSVVSGGGNGFGIDTINATFTLEAVTGSSVLLGDVDMNGVINFLDITPFVAILTAGDFKAEADCDENGVVNFLDISPFIAILNGT